MAATAIIELCLLMYTLWRHRSTKLGKLAAATLLFLAIFQIAEYNVCGGLCLDATLWSRVGFMVIAALPPLGIHMATTIAKHDIRWLRWSAYATAMGWILTFGFTERIFANHACGGNYIIFHVKPHFAGLYLFHYYFWLFAGIFLCLWLAKKVKQRQKESLLLLAFGYLTFMIPTALANTIKPQSIEGIPSILCGFAVIFAILLVFGILPNETAKPTKKRT
jgi:hypothetical protein